MVNRIVPFLTLVFQIIAATLTLFCVWSLFCLVDYNGGIDGWVTLVVWQFVYGSVIIAVLILTGLILGLPIRLIVPVNRWWKLNQKFCYWGIFAGIILDTIALIKYASETPLFALDQSNYNHRPISTAFFSFTCAALFITAFFILNFYPGRFIKGMMSRFKNISIKNRSFDSLLGR
ncbi:hypothetical protein MUY27_07030 [Mucilaginibacter sp. RS28]|uniref:Uncharacterized protein n=1 Tax=Mucilaginibacter straminoryzae TaxID=2932774 RepID=A0A9X1X251_9SPHI|nr:hypothetical protein [Mucilaginibacter straminoryzae]MCJ8209456.1 hypothetical protein [Mucilaginibacter straminoryzae]